MEPDTRGVLKKEEVQAEKKFNEERHGWPQGFTWGVDGNTNNDDNLTKPEVGKTLIYGSYLLDCPCMEDLDTGYKHPFCRNPECRTSWSVSATVCYLWRQHSRKNCNRLSPHLLPRGGMLDMRLPLKVQISINKLQIKCDSRCFFLHFPDFLWNSGFIVVPKVWISLLASKPLAQIPMTTKSPTIIELVVIFPIVPWILILGNCQWPKQDWIKRPSLITEIQKFGLDQFSVWGMVEWLRALVYLPGVMIDSQFPWDNRLTLSFLVNVFYYYDALCVDWLSTKTPSNQITSAWSFDVWNTFSEISYR